MNDRTVSVGLRIGNGQFNRGLAQSAALVKAFSLEMAGSGRSTNLASQELDRYAGKTRPLVALVQDFGVALIPIAAAGIPAVTGLAAGLGVAAAAGATLVLAFHGIGSAVTAVNKAAINPTTANIKAARIAMDQLSTAGQHMVETLVSFKGAYQELRNSAQTGLFPGLEKGLLLLHEQLPQIELFVHDMGKALGQLGHQAAVSFGGPQWDKFRSFVTEGAPKAANGLGVATGHLVHALAELTMGFAPLNTSLLNGVINVSKAFDTWSTNLSKTQGFQNFLAYLQRTGPVVAQLLGRIAVTLADIVKAGAPIGESVLPILTKVVDVIDAIAKSPLAAPILGLLALGRAMSLLGSAMRIGPAKWAVSVGKDIAALGPRAAAAALGIKGVGDGSLIAARDLAVLDERAVRSAQVFDLTTKSWTAASRMSSAEFALMRARWAEVTDAVVGSGLPLSKSLAKGVKEYAQTTSGLKNLAYQGGKTAGILLLLAASSSTLTDKIGLTNTAMDATLGFVAGDGWGALIGGTIGLVIDLKNAWSDAGKVSTASIDTITQALSGQSKVLQDDAKMTVALSLNYTTALKAAGLSLGQVTAAGLKGGNDLDLVLAKIAAAKAKIGPAGLGPDPRQSAASYQAQQKTLDSLDHLGTALVDTGGKADQARKKQADLAAAAKAVAEADRIAAAAVEQHGAALSSFNRVVGETLLGLKAVQGALSLTDAQFASVKAWQDLEATMKKNGDTFSKYTAKGQENWGKLKAAVDSNLAIVDQLQKAGKQAAAQSVLRRTLTDAENFVKKFPAARSVLQDTIDLLRKKVSTNIFSNTLADLRNFGREAPKAAGAVDKLIQKMRDARGSGSLRDALHALQDFKAKFPGAAAAVQPLIDKLKAINKLQIKPKITLADEDYRHKFDRIVRDATGLDHTKAGHPKVTVEADTHDAVAKINAFKAKLSEVDKAKAKPSIDAQTGQAMAHLIALQSYINSMHGKSITVTTFTNTLAKHAGGGPIYGVGGPRDDANLARVSNGEWVMSADAVSHYGPSFMDDVNMRRFASGGSTDKNKKAGPAPAGFWDKLLKALTDANFGPGKTREFSREYAKLVKEYHKHGWTKEVNDAAHQLAKDIRTAALDQKKAINQAFHGFALDLSQGASSIRDEVKSLRRSLIDAGGVWNSALNKHAQKILDLSKKYDRHAATLTKDQQALDDTVSAMNDLVSQTKGNFDNSPFGKQQGLAGFFAQEQTDTTRANAFNSVLAQLKQAGLSDEAYKQLAGSGDLDVAQQLLSSGQITQFNSAISDKTNALNTLGNTVGNTAYGQQIQAQTDAVNRQTAILAGIQSNVDRQEKVLHSLAGLITQVGTNLPRATQDGTYQGAYDGVRDAVGGAGRRLVRNGARS